MSKYLLNFVLMFCTCFSMAQDIHLSFSTENSGAEVIDSIIVLNMGSGQRIKLSGTEILILNSIPTGIPTTDMSNGNGFLYPNPADGFAHLDYVCDEEGRLEFKLFNATGSLSGSYSTFLTRGMHQFRVTFPAPGLYIVNLRHGNVVSNLKVISMETKRLDFKVDYLGGTEVIQNTHMVKKAYTGEQRMDYWDGDILQFTLYSGRNITVMTDSPKENKEIVVDFYPCASPDNRHYKTVKIGEQVWMAENLAYLPSVSPVQTGSETVPHYYVYDYDGTDLEAARQNPHYQTYGVLYNWTAALTACPEGWHLPSNDEWNELELTLGMTPAMIENYYWRGTHQGNLLKNSYGWNNNGNGTNSVGFCALPGGWRTYDRFLNVGYRGNWWSSTEYNNTISWDRNLAYDQTRIGRWGGNKVNGFSVRCIKD